MKNKREVTTRILYLLKPGRIQLLNLLNDKIIAIPLEEIRKELDEVFEDYNTLFRYLKEDELLGFVKEHKKDERFFYEITSYGRRVVTKFEELMNAVENYG